MTERYEILTVEQHRANFLRESVATRVRRLRNLADRIEQEAERNIKRAEAGSGTYATVAHDAIHEAMWGLANLHLETLASTASEADVAHAKGE